MALGEERIDTESTFEIQRQACYRYFVQFGMPIFFYISGISSTNFNFEKEEPFWRFFIGKVKRLINPFILGIFFLLMPQLYIIQDWCSWGRLDDGQFKEHNIFKFYYKQFQDQFLMKLASFWFLLFLFILMMLNYPMIKWTSRRSRKLPFEREDKITIG